MSDPNLKSTVKTYGRDRSKAMQDMTNIYSSITPSTLGSTVSTTHTGSPNRKSMKRVFSEHEANGEHGGIENASVFDFDGNSTGTVTRMSRSSSLSSIPIEAATTFAAAAKTTVVAKPSAAAKTAADNAAITRHSKSKRLNRFEDLVSTGCPEDIKMLIGRMKAAEKLAVSKGSIVSGRQQHMARIYDDGMVKSDSYLRWLTSLGFIEDLWGEAIVYDIPTERMKELRTILSKTDAWRRVALKKVKERTFSDLRGRITPLVISVPTDVPADPRAFTPSRILAESFADITIRGETPRSVSRDTPSASFARALAGSTEPPLSNTETTETDPVEFVEHPTIEEEEDEDAISEVANDTSVPTSIMETFEEHDDHAHDAEVHSIMVFKSGSSCGGGVYMGSDAGSSRCSHAMSSNLLQQSDDFLNSADLCTESTSPPQHMGLMDEDRDSLSSSVPIDPMPMGAFTGKGTAASNAIGRNSYHKRKATRNKRSLSAPIPYHATPSSPVNFSRTHTIGAYATPTKYPYATTAGANTLLLAKCRNADLDTCEGSPKKSNYRVLGCSSAELPALHFPPYPDDAVESSDRCIDEYTVQSEAMNRAMYASCPFPSTSNASRRESARAHSSPAGDSNGHDVDSFFLSSSRRALENRNRNDLVRVSSISINDSSPIVTCGGEKMCVIHESGEESGADDSAMMSLMISRDVRMSTLKKKRLSNSKKIRMSIRGGAVGAGGGGGARRPRRSSIFSLKYSSRNAQPAPAPFPLSPLRSVVVEPVLPMQLSEDNFFPIVIGGVYQQTFELNRPVVYESSPAYPRVLAIDMPMSSTVIDVSNSVTRLRKWYLSFVHSQTYSVYESAGDLLSITVLVPGENMPPQAPISLGSAWAVIPASPGGLLIVCTEYCCENDKRRMCFFIPDSFLRKELMCDVEQNEFTSLSAGGGEAQTAFSMGLDMDMDACMDPSMNASQCTEATEADDMDCLDLRYGALDTSVASEGSNNYGNHFHQHLLEHLDSGIGISPTGSYCSPVVALPSALAAAAIQVEITPELPQRVSISTGISAQGREFFEHLLYNEQSPFLGCREPDLVNSGDIMELVLPFLQCREDSVGGGRSLRRVRSTRANSGPTGYSAVKLVSKRWAVNWIRHRSSQWALKHWDLTSPSIVSEQYLKWVSFIKRFKVGSPIGCGGAKTVFRMQRAGSGLMQRALTHADAVAVMDVENVLEHAVQQELVVSVACSSLVKCGICPNVVQIHSTFQSPFPVPPMWQSVSSTFSIPTADSMSLGHYQYINMEFCAGGDIEDHIRKQRRRVLPASDIRNMFFQMCFSIYSCRDQVALRHFDIKLLNFLLADSSVLIKGDTSTSTKYDKVAYRIGFGGNVYSLQLSLSPTAPGLVKLADFGTSLIGQEESSSSGITAQQFTTLENTPPEFLFLGSAASSSFAADTFGLGLSFLHMVTGNAPYEELLENIRCPVALQIQLQEVWANTSADSPYAVIGEVLRSLDASIEVDMDDSDVVDDAVLSVLYDTLYRYVVLSGLPNPDLFTTTSASDSSDDATRNPVVCALLRTLDQGGNETASETVAEATMQFLTDSELWNIFTGKHDIMRGARKKLAELSLDAEQWVRRMLCFDPVHRCLMIELMTSAMFEPLVETNASIISNSRNAFTRHQAAASAGTTFTASFMHYSRPEENGGERLLPML